ncbi:MAG: winged helix-turn-helix domain-containing protein [Proteobacteria bacterium]|nr:winged helix-turn-helix domain-containing protein [Pseudomonadota bacterium]
MLAYLALNAGQPQSRDKLAALLWGERFDEQARQSLRQGISKLRKALADGDPKALVIDGDDVGLNTDAAVIDAVEFERLASEGTPAALNEAAGLYIGGLLEGLEVKEKGFEDWIGTERSRFGELAAGVLAKLSRHQADAGDTDAAIETAKRLTTVDPLSEEGHRTLMRLYAENGKRAQALKQFKTLEAALRSELNVDPEQKTRNLYEEIQSNESPEPASRKPDSAPAAPALPNMPSVAVLPFENLSGDPEQEYFSDGITDDLITALSNVRAFFVIDRGSSFTYKGRAVDVKEVGRELGVHYVLEGSVRKAGDRVRVSAELIDTTTGNHVWADRYDGGLDDIFDLQDEIAASVVGAIEPQIHRAEVERIRHKRPESFDAYDLTLCGLAKMNKLTAKDSADALDLFMKAIDLAPNYARAYACASYCHRRHVQLKGLVISDADKAEALRLAQAAFKADRTDPFVLWHTGMAIGLLEGDLDEAAALIDRSLSINANANRAWLASATIRCFLGEPETVIEHAERAMRLSPLDVSMWVAHGVLAVAHMQLKNYQEAVSWGRKAIRLHRDNIPPHYVLVASLAQMGRQEEAEAALDELLDLEPGLTIKGLKKRFPIAGYRNLDGFLEGLKKAGIKA